MEKAFDKTLPKQKNSEVRRGITDNINSYLGKKNPEYLKGGRRTKKRKYRRHRTNKHKHSKHRKHNYTHKHTNKKKRWLHIKPMQTKFNNIMVNEESNQFGNIIEGLRKN
jgi:hypothetical protein